MTLSVFQLTLSSQGVDKLKTMKFYLFVFSSAFVHCQLLENRSPLHKAFFDHFSSCLLRLVIPQKPIMEETAITDILTRYRDKTALILTVQTDRYITGRLNKPT